MLCKICNKNPATIHIQEIVNGEKKTLHICAGCAAQKSKEDPVLNGFNLAEMLYSLSGQMGAQEGDKQEQPKDGEEVLPLSVCPKCGWDSARFRKTGRLGCANCYSVFEDIVIPALANMHRGSFHVGKAPGAAGSSGSESGRRMLELMKLQKELEDHVRREEFEKAAEVRDRINALKAESASSSEGEGSQNA